MSGGRAIIQYANGIVDFQSSSVSAAATVSLAAVQRAALTRKTTASMYAVRRPRDKCGAEPACVNLSTGAIHFGSKEDMKTLAGERGRAENRGYDNARGSQRDPAGVGGTHVVAHCCIMPTKPENLPITFAEKRNQQKTVKILKSVWKPKTPPAFGLPRPLPPASSICRRRSEPRGRGR